MLGRVWWILCHIAGLYIIWDVVVLSHSWYIGDAGVLDARREEMAAGLPFPNGAVLLPWVSILTTMALAASELVLMPLPWTGKLLRVAYVGSWILHLLRYLLTVTWVTALSVAWFQLLLLLTGVAAGWLGPINASADDDASAEEMGKDSDC